MTPRTIGPYRVIESLEPGGLGEVWLVEDTRSGAHRVLRCPDDRWLGEPGMRRRFMDEARAAAEIRHPAVARLHGTFELGGRPVLVFDYVEGEPLDRPIARGGLTVERALVLGIDVADGLAAAHTAGVCHHDLKPSQVRVTPEGRAVVLDVGVSRPPRAATARVPRSLVSRGDAPIPFAGTAGYAAPEQITGRSTDRRSDVYSLGAVLFEMLTGRRPFEDDDVAGVALATLTGPVPSVRRFNPAVPPSVDAVVARALAKSPADRFQSAREFADEMRAQLRALGARPVMPMGDQWAAANPAATRPATSTARRILIGVILLAVALSLVLASL